LTDAPPTTRLEDFRALMQSRKVDAAFVTRPVSIAYLTGVHANPYERLMALVVGRDQATLIVPAIELENAERVKPAHFTISIGWA